MKTQVDHMKELKRKIGDSKFSSWLWFNREEVSDIHNVGCWNPVPSDNAIKEQEVSITMKMKKKTLKRDM